ncbi:esterase/lipase family protein [Thalassoglobus sp.]|uniref:esterase/lipase family protein n=1 Tax=Thalassoglobus sp. TaxID=2795869 RepID=UPI003AA9545C
MTTEQVDPTGRPAKAVILLHGLLNPSAAMWVLQRRFRNKGYLTLNFGYRSFFQSIDQIAEKTILRCQQFHDALPDDCELSIVGHSLGAILTRYLVQQRKFPKLRRVVLLTPPNQGSHVASRMGKVCRRFLPVVEELADSPDSFVNRMSQQMPVETGVIASAPDYLIDVKCTHISSETDFTTMPGPHGIVIFRKAVFEQSLHFLEQGRFSRLTES